MDDPYEPHPHDLPPREYSTPPPPPAYDHHPTPTSWDMPVPAAVSQEGEKKHQFRKGARGMHSEPVLLRKKFSWRNYPEVSRDKFDPGLMLFFYFFFLASTQSLHPSLCPLECIEPVFILIA
jgi:hypothetical protein